MRKEHTVSNGVLESWWFKICSCAKSAIFLIFLVVLWQGCTSSPRFATGSGSSGAVGVDPGATPVLSIEGIASYYAHEFHGRQTANGEMYDMHDLTAAHKTFPFNTIVQVQNLENGNTIVVRINDRGPFIEGRIIDLSYAAARKINLIQSGTARVKLDVLQWGEQ
jgi:3D (Asp-Asp-Asp) domain-containing protein